MKNIKFFGLLSVAALAMSVSSCTNDNEPVISENETGNNTESGVFTIKANIGELQQTRATVKPEDGKSFTWQQNDVFSLYQSSDMTTANTFTIDNSGISSDGKSADFNCSSFAPVEGETFYAFYPQCFITTDNKTFTYTIPDGVYTQTGDNNTDHLNKGMIMFATGKSADIQNSVTFEHKTALFRFGISNLKSETVTVNSIKLSSSGTKCFAKQYTYNTEGTETVDLKSAELNLNFSEGVTLAAKGTDGNIMKAYTLAIPADDIAVGETETFTLEVTYNEGSTITNKIILGSDKSFAAGNVYTFNIDIEDYSKFYLTGTYNGWGWDNCQYIYKIGEGVYRGIIYMEYVGTEYKWKVTENTNWDRSWPEGDDMNTMRSCIFTLYTVDNTIKDQNIQQCNAWYVSGAFNGWGNDKIMTYGFDGEHYLIAENVEIIETAENNFYWKLRGDEWSAQVNSAKGVKVQGDAEALYDQDDNFKVTAGAGTYEFKWYFNLPQPKIVVTKK